MKSSQASPRLPSIFTAENKAIATPSRQPAPGTPGSSKASSTNSTSKSQSRPASNQTLHLTPPPMVPAKSTKNTHSSSSNNNNNNNSMSRAATTPRTPLRAVPNSMVTPTSTSRSVIKDQSNKSLSLSSQKKSNKQQRHSPSTTSSKSTPKNRQGTHTAAPSSVSAGCTDTGTRMNLDKRSARLRYSNDFSNEIARLRQESSTSRSTTSTATPDDDKVLQDENNNKDDQGVLVFVRKRPIFRDELQRGDFDVVATTSSELDLTASSSTSGANSVVVYRTQMHADMKTKQVQPVVFGCTAAFDEKASSVHVYRTVAMPLVQQAVTGGVATLLMFGQTGSGKTFTMNAVEELSAADVFNFAPTNIKAASTSGKQITVQVRYLELSGKSCRDLLEDSRPEVRIMDNNNEDGSVCFVNATSVVVETAEELVKVMAEAKHRRATQATDKNDESSRSHAVCQMTIYARDAAEEKNHAARQRGVLTLVDCAGTERRNDSMYHSKSRQAESNEINASLYALKECIRARSSSASSQSQQGYVPYRSNNLTRVLRESLERQDASLAVIATVAPNATDTEHTIQTLKTVSTLSGLPSEEGRLQKVSNTSKLGEEHPIAPKRWDHKALVEWLSEKNLVEKAVPGHVDGKLVSAFFISESISWLPYLNCLLLL
jgi:kinesin family protein 2/24